MTERDKSVEPVVFDTGRSPRTSGSGQGDGFREAAAKPFLPRQAQPVAQDDFDEAGDEARRHNLGNMPASLQELDAREGNYIISFGYPGSGKSNFQSFLARWIERGGEFVPGVGSIDAWDNSKRLINLWREDWDANRFAGPTDRGPNNITEVRLSARPKSGQKTPLTFGFLEMPGEEQQRVIPEDGSPSLMSPALVKFLRNKKINAILVLFVDPERRAGQRPNDTIFMNLLDYMDANFSPDEVERLSLLLVVPKPARALSYLRQLPAARERYQGIDHAEDLNSDLLRLFLELTIPGTYARVTEWPGKWDYARFYIGDVVEGESTMYTNPSLDDTSKIFAWIYQIFTGRELGKSRWEKFLSLFDLSR